MMISRVSGDAVMEEAGEGLYKGKLVVRLCGKDEVESTGCFEQYR